MKMNKLMIGIFIFVLTGLVMTVEGAEIPLNFAWDSNVNDGSWAVVKIFVRVGDDSQYDYDTPLLEIPQQYEAGLSLPTTATVNFNFPDGEKTYAYFVARAYDSSGNQSIDSNETLKVVDLVPLENFTFTAEYNNIDQSIDFVWSMTDVRSSRYRIYKALDQTAEKEPLAKIDFVADQTQYSKQIAIDDLFPPEEKTTVYFWMAAWGGEKPELIQSEYIGPIPITIDRRTNVSGVDTVINFKLILE